MRIPSSARRSEGTPSIRSMIVSGTSMPGTMSRRYRVPPTERHTYTDGRMNTRSRSPSSSHLAMNTRIVARLNTIWVCTNSAPASTFFSKRMGRKS